MSQGHRNLGNPGMTQNQGNVLGDRPCVRQSRLYREHVGGNAMKDLMGQSDLKWDVTQTQGAYQGGRVHGDGSSVTPHSGVSNQQFQGQQAPQPLQQQPQQQAPSQRGPFKTKADIIAEQQQQQQAPAPTAHRRGAGNANKQTYNILTGE